MINQQYSMPMHKNNQQTQQINQMPSFQSNQSFSDAQIQKILQENTNLIQQVDLLQSENKKLQIKFQSIENQYQNEFQVMLQNLSGMNEKYVLKDFQQAEFQNDKLKQEFENLKNVNKKFESDNLQKDGQIQLHKNEKKQAQEKLATLIKELESITENFKQLSDKYKNQQQHLTFIEQEKQNLIEELKSQKQILVKQQNEFEDWKVNNKDDYQLLDLKHQMNLIQSEKKNQSNLIQEIKQEKIYIQEQNHKLTTKLQMIEQQCNQLKLANDSLTEHKNFYENKFSQNENLFKDKEELQQQLLQQKHNIDFLKSQLEQALKQKEFYKLQAQKYSQPDQLINQMQNTPGQQVGFQQIFDSENRRNSQYHK